MSDIIGAKHFDNRDLTYYQQRNNPHEEAVRKLMLEFLDMILKNVFKGQRTPEYEQIKQILLRVLETCGPTAFIMCIAALIGDKVNIVKGEYTAQPEQFVMDALHDFTNYEMFMRFVPGLNPYSTMNNRIPQLYVYLAKLLFDIEAVYINGIEYDICRRHLTNHGTALVLLKDPGHFRAGVAAARVENELVANDPWADYLPKKEGFNIRMTKTEFIENTKPHLVLFYPPEAS